MKIVLFLSSFQRNLLGDRDSNSEYFLIKKNLLKELMIYPEKKAKLYQAVRVFALPMKSIRSFVWVYSFPHMQIDPHYESHFVSVESLTGIELPLLKRNYLSI